MARATREYMKGRFRLRDGALVLRASEGCDFDGRAHSNRRALIARRRGAPIHRDLATLQQPAHLRPRKLELFGQENVQTAARGVLIGV